MKIKFLDKATLGNDLDFSMLEKQGDVEYFETTSPEQVVERIRDADVIITNKVVIGQKEMDKSPKLKLINVAATGYNNIDIKAANKRNIIVTNVKGYSTESVAQHFFAYVLNYYNSVNSYIELTKNGMWQKSQVFTILSDPIDELKNKTLGIIGYGAIGKRISEIAKAFGMKILIGKVPGRQYSDALHIDFEEVIKNADILTIHTPLTPLTKNLITIKELKMMKNSAVLVNLARGGIVNEQDLFEALQQNQISQAIVDVLTVEPPRQGNILLKAPNIMITPHIAWTSKQARKKLLEGIIRNIQKFKKGEIKEIALFA